MKIYVHKEGENYGPYSVSQLKEYLQAGNFIKDDLACHDGANWVKLSEVPGIEEVASKIVHELDLSSSKPDNNLAVEAQIKTDNQKVKPTRKSRKKALILTGTVLASISLIGILTSLFMGNGQDQIVHKNGSEKGLENISLKGKPAPMFATFDPRPAARKIDDFLYANLEKVEVSPNDQISDEQFLRRAYLNVIGRIPSISEADEFHQSTSEDKHSLIVRKLLYNDAGYTAHHYQFWADLLRIPTGIDYTLYYREWIKDEIRINTPYDELARKLVSGHGLIFDNPAAAYYLRDAGMALDNMSNSARIFLGTRLECAQCHDHPFDKWTQMDYFRMAAYTYDFDVRMGTTKDSNRQKIYQDLNKRKWKAYTKASGFDDFPHLHNESKIEEWLSRPFATKYLENNNLTEAQFREAAIRGFAARKEMEEFDQPVSQSINMLYGHISNVQVKHHKDKPLQLPHDYQYDDGKPGDIVIPDTMFGPDIPIFEDPKERKNAYAKWLTSKENPRFTRVIVNRLWKRAFGHGLFEPVDNLTDRTEISQPELLSFLESLMQDLNYDIRAFQNVLLHTDLFRREMHLEDHSAGMKFHFAGPLLKRMSAEQIWDSISTLILPGIDTHAPNKKRTLDRIARTRDIYKSLEGRPIEEVMPKIKKAGDLRRQIRDEQVNYEKQISAAYTSGDNALASKLTKELKEKVREMEKKNRDLVFVDLKEKYPDSPVMMGGAMMGGMMTSTTAETNERI